MSRGDRVVTIGETMALISASQHGRLQHAHSMRLGIGGAESNVAIGLRRLGVNVSWIGKVGSDSLGDLVLREITAEEVEVIAFRDPEYPTSLMVKERRTSTDTQVWYYRRGNAGSRLRADELDSESVVTAIRGASILHLTGISPALSPEMAEATFHALQLANDAGVRVSFDLNFRSKLWSRAEARRTYQRIIPQADFVFAGEDEAAIAVGGASSPLDLAHRLVDEGAEHAIIKLGAQGAAAVMEGKEYVRPALAINAIDTVGAGDAFVAGYLADLLAEEPVEERLMTAVTAGAYVCLTEGDWEGAPRRSELARLNDAESVHR